MIELKVPDMTCGHCASTITKAVKESVDLDASSTSEITAVVPSVAVSVARGGKAGVGAAIGISVARNIIGAREDNIPYDYTTASTPDAIHTGDTVKVADGGPRDEDVYEYIGEDFARFEHRADETSAALAKGERVWVDAEHSGTAATGIYRYLGEDATVDLTSADFTETDLWENVDVLNLQAQNFGDPTAWRRVDLSPSRSEIQAGIRNSSIYAGGDLTARCWWIRSRPS